MGGIYTIGIIIIIIYKGIFQHIDQSDCCSASNVVSIITKIIKSIKMLFGKLFPHSWTKNTFALYVTVRDIVS